MEVMAPALAGQALASQRCQEVFNGWDARNSHLPKETLMQSDLQKLLKPDAVKKFRDKSELLNSPLSVFNFVSDDQVKKLRDAKITMVRDLATVRDPSAIGV